jgi:outer membrane protein TolC
MARKFYLLLVAAVTVAAGCRTAPTAAEKVERERLEAEAKRFLPKYRPALPALTADSAPAEQLRWAMLNQPSVTAAYFDWAAAVARIPAARTPPDPRLTVQADIQKVVMSLMPGLMFDFPGPGKLAAGAEIASAESEAKYHAFTQAALQAAFNMKKASCELRTLDARLELSRRTLSLMVEMEQLAEARNAAGKATLQDVLRARIEQERMRSEIRNLEDSRAPLLERFKAALGITPEQPAPPAPKQFFPEAPAGAGTAARLDDALQRNPELLAMQAEIRRADAELTLARKANIPDFNAGLEADVKAVPLMFRPSAGMTLPVWRERIASDVTAAESAKHAAAARLAAARIMLAAEFAEKRFMVREAERNLELLSNQLIPLAERALEAAKSGYAAGSGDFLDLLDAQRTLIGFRLAQEDARLQRELALAALALVLAERER